MTDSAPSLEEGALSRSERDTVRPGVVRKVVRLPVLAPDGDRVEPKALGEPLFQRVHSWLQRLDAATSRFLPEEMNPLAQTGAIANVTFIIAIASGVALLFWYKTSVHQAHDSVLAMMQAPLGAGLVRSLHRYSSDACMLFVLLHALKLFFARRFGGARWLAWITGLVLIGLLWFVGWLGYWLVWDQRGKEVALGTARLLDVLPIFADPLSRSFLVDEKVSSLLFFVVFFLHMLLPLAMGISLWLHITRLARSRFLTRRNLTLWVVASMLLLSALAPADVGGPAKMAISSERGALDFWYLAPLLLTDRLGAGALWALLLIGGAVGLAVPWWLVRGRARVAHTEIARCNACKNCFDDCPYEAVQMVPRTDDRPYPTMALVDPDKCVGCGICSGSCDSAAIGIHWFSQVDQRLKMDAMLKDALEHAGASNVAFVCAESAGANLAIQADGTCAELPGYRVLRIPCAGWVQFLTVERALRRGANRALIVGCGPGGCKYREGTEWARERLEGKREPKLRTSKVDPERVRILELFGTEQKRLVEEAREFARGNVGSRRTPLTRQRIAAGVLLAGLLGAATWGVTRIAYAAPLPGSPFLIVSFKHPGSAAEKCRTPSPAELEKLPPHMRRPQICERRRADVRLRVRVDGREILQKSYAPKGIWHDGNSIALERVPLPAGEHDVTVEIADTPGEIWNHRTERRVHAVERRTSVVLFDKMSGYQWYE